LGLMRRATKKGLAVEDSGCAAAYVAALGLMEPRFRPAETGKKVAVHPVRPDRERKRG
jgi:hypothetical protein